LRHEISDYYLSHDEHSRLTDDFSLERLRTQKIIQNQIGSSKKNIIDVGGGTGIYSFWLAKYGHKVTLIDLMPNHIEKAKSINGSSKYPLSAIQIGNALSLDYGNNHFDIALNMGPLYHLQNQEDRILAIQESLRVVKPGGYVLISVISRFASLIDGFSFDFVDDPQFRKILDEDLKSGTHKNETNNLAYFTTAYFHTLSELKFEIQEAGGGIEKVVAVEGFSKVVPDLYNKLKSNSFRTYLLQKIEETEAEETMLGLSSHWIAIIKKKEAV
jgi:2-polyprenyl-3-methyl-5-hydroxy-6-metoxy-1,4-benzoquinol methylase